MKPCTIKLRQSNSDVPHLRWLHKITSATLEQATPTDVRNKNNTKKFIRQRLTADLLEAKTEYNKNSLTVPVRTDANIVIPLDDDDGASEDDLDFVTAKTIGATASEEVLEIS
jgi:hypothetical protein